MIILWFIIAYFVLDALTVAAARSNAQRRRRQIQQQKQQQIAARMLERAAAAQEKARREEQKLMLNRLSLEQIEAQREKWLDLYSMIEEEYNSSYTTQARRLSLAKQMVTLDEKIMKIDLKRAELYLALS